MQSLVSLVGTVGEFCTEANLPVMSFIRLIKAERVALIRIVLLAKFPISGRNGYRDIA